MATERATGQFGQVSRLKGTVFEALSFGASVFGIVALAVLLVYVFVDAFDLANASPEWLLTYFTVLVVPYLVFCLYSADEPALTARVVTVLGGGLVAVAVGFTAVEALIRPIPRLSWQLTYLFVVVAPITGYATVVGSRGVAGRVGFGVLGRLLGGLGLGLAVTILFLVFDPRLWYLAYTLGVVPAVAASVYGRRNPDSIASTVAVPAGIVGLVLAVVLRSLLGSYPPTLVIYVWSIALPIAGMTGALVGLRRDRRAGVAAGAAVLTVAVAGGLVAGAFGLPAASSVLVLSVAAAPTIAFVGRVAGDGTDLVGLSLPVVLLGGMLVGALIVESAGLVGPDPWLDYAYVTSPPSRTPEDAGLYPAIVGSVLIIAVVAVLSFVLGIGSAVFLEEYAVGSGAVGTITRIIQINIANLAAVPSVVYGLLGLGLFANLLGLGFGTVLTAALTLSLLILPITVISAQEAVRAVPDDLRRGSYAMGATRWQTVRRVVLPEALPGILTGTILALGRAIGETAPLIMIGAATTVFSPPNGIWGTVSAMPMQIFSWADRPQADFRYGVLAAGVVTLLIVLLAMNATAIILRNRAERES